MNAKIMGRAITEWFERNFAAIVTQEYISPYHIPTGIAIKEICLKKTKI